MSDESKKTEAMQDGGTAAPPASVKKKSAGERRAAKKARRALKKARKQAKKQRALKPLFMRPLVCPPEAADGAGASRVWGLILRAAVLCLAVFGMTFFVSDALGFFKEETAGVGVPMLLVSAIVATAAFVCCSLRRVRRVAIPLTAAAAVGGAAFLAAGGRLEYIYRAVVNCVVEHLYSRGYLAIIKYEQPESYGGYTVHELVGEALILLTVLYAAAYVPFLIRRTRIILPTIVSVITLVPIFVYNLTSSNWGMTLVIASFSGVLVMCVYDRFYQRRPDPDDFDTETVVFESAPLPVAPDELTSREQKKADRRAAKKQKKADRAAKRRDRRHKHELRRGIAEVSADEDISDYFAPKAKKPKRSAPRRERKPRLGAAEKKARREERRRIKAETRRRDRDIIAARRRAKDGARKLSADRAAAAGYAGMLMTAAALLMLFIPTLTTEENFKLIDAIDAKLDYYREYVTALLMGDDPLLDELAYAGTSYGFEPRSTEPQQLSFTGAKLMEVTTPTSMAPIYLRGWVATDYDSEAGAWVTADPDSDTFKTYRSYFGTSIDPSESMLNGLYSYVAPSAIKEVDFTAGRYASSSTYGFITMQVSMKRLDLKNYFVYMPSFYVRSYNPQITTSSGKTARAMLAYESGEASELTYTNYFDGIYTGYRFKNDTEGYSTIARVTYMKNSVFYKNMAKAIVEFNTDRVLIQRDETEKAESMRRYGSIADDAGVFRTLSTENGGYSVSYLDGTSFYDVIYDTDSNLTYIVFPDEKGTVTYTYDTETMELVDSQIVLSPTYEDSGIYVSVPELPNIIGYYELMTEAERGELESTWRINDYYTDFVYKTYTGKADSKIISDLLQQIISEAHTESIDYTDDGEVIKTTVPRDFSRAAERVTQKDTAPYKLTEAVTDAEVYEQRHRLVMEIIDWLCDNCTYTITPTLSDAEGYDGVEKFLSITHEGYCVQFASSLTLMLREAGIPARYVEGYIAGGFVRSGGRSLSYVRDYNAHAWVEVWYDGVGWVQYEATPEYYSTVYEYNSESSLPVGPVSPGNDNDDDGDGEDDYTGLTDEELAELLRQQEEEERRRLIIKICTAVAFAAGISLVPIAAFFILRRAARKKEAERAELLATIASLGTRGAAGTAAELSAEEKRALLRRYGDLISTMLAECGCAPRDGEFREEYCARIYDELGALLRISSATESRASGEMRHGPVTETELARCLELIAAAEFGGSGTDLRVDSQVSTSLTVLWQRLYENVYPRRVGRLRRAALYYIYQKL